MIATGAAAPHRQASGDARDIAKAKSAVAYTMRDPSSVQFRGVQVSAGQQEGKAVCGEVNAKNGFGGYVGFRRFVYETALDDVRVEDGSDRMFDLYAKDCR